MPTLTNYRIARSRAGTLALAAALEAPAAALCRDLGGGWRLKGRHGHATPDPTGGYALCLYSPSRWARCRRAFRVIRIPVVDVSEGVFSLDRLPGPVEACVIRAILGVDHRLAGRAKLSPTGKG